MRKLVIATKNPGKAREMAQVLSGIPYEIVSLADYAGAPDIEETGSTFIENAILKATAYADFTGELTLADDSGLEVDALDGAPGVLSSRFAPTDPERNAKLLDLMSECPRRPTHRPLPLRHRHRRTNSPPRRGGWGGHSVRTCEGTIDGTIAHEPKGTNGFGYDPDLLRATPRQAHGRAHPIRQERHLPPRPGAQESETTANLTSRGPTFDFRLWTFDSPVAFSRLGCYPIRSYLAKGRSQ